jgi:Hydrolytic ATP binding site of dynein motor region
MVTPDCTAVAEVVLFGEGFSTAPWLAKKAVAVYCLAEEQLSQQVRQHSLLHLCGAV